MASSFGGPSRGEGSWPGGEPSPSPGREPLNSAPLEVPFTRHGGRDVVQRASAQYPGTPILALSPTFFSNVECGGNCARSLGVAGVLPKPIGRDTLIATVRNLLHPRE